MVFVNKADLVDDEMLELVELEALELLVNVLLNCLNTGAIRITLRWY